MFCFETGPCCVVLTGLGQADLELRDLPASTSVPFLSPGIEVEDVYHHTSPSLQCRVGYYRSLCPCSWFLNISFYSSWNSCDFLTCSFCSVEMVPSVGLFGLSVTLKQIWVPMHARYHQTTVKPETIPFCFTLVECCCWMFLSGKERIGFLRRILAFCLFVHLFVCFSKTES